MGDVFHHLISHFAGNTVLKPYLGLFFQSIPNLYNMFSSIISSVLAVIVRVYELLLVLRLLVPYLFKMGAMELKQDTDARTIHRLNTISNNLREIRFSEGKLQDELIDWGASRRQIQRGEQGFNLTLASLFILLDCYGYRLDEFFEGME